MPTSEKILVLKNSTKPITKFLTKGKRIQYQLKNDPTIYHGQIKKIQNDSLIVNNDAVYFTNLKMIHGKPVKLEAARIIGGIFLIVGTLALFIGISALRARHGAEYPFMSGMFSVLGIVMVYLGIGGDIMGLIPFLIRNKTYDIEHEWNIKSGERKRRSWFRKSKNDCCD